MRDIKYIVYHCTATPEGRDVSVQDIDSWHKAKGWKGIGYHWVVYLDGSVHKGRNESEVGAHVQGFNKDSIGIVYVGGCDKDMKPKDTRTELQKESLKKIYLAMKKQYPDAEHLGHCDFWFKYKSKAAPKACPSFDVTKWIESI